MSIKFSKQELQKSIDSWTISVKYNRNQLLSSIALAGAGVAIDVASLTYGFTSKDPLGFLPMILGTPLAIGYGIEASQELDEYTGSVSTVALLEYQLEKTEE